MPDATTCATCSGTGWVSNGAGSNDGPCPDCKGNGFNLNFLHSKTGQVTSTDVTNIVRLTQTAYNALTPDANTLYIIIG